MASGRVVNLFPFSRLNKGRKRNQIQTLTVINNHGAETITSTIFRLCHTNLQKRKMKKVSSADSAGTGRSNRLRRCDFILWDATSFYLSRTDVHVKK